MPSPHSTGSHSPLHAGFVSYRSTGSPAGLAEALQGVRPELIRIARYQLRQQDAAEDVVQATLLSAIEQAQAFDPERRLIPWLCGILQNKIASHHRRQRRTFSELNQDRLMAPNPHKVVEDQEAQALVGRALSQLPKHYRDVLDLHLNQGLDGGEIAQRLRRPEGTIRAQIHRGLIRLRHLLPAGLATSLLFSRRNRLQAQTPSANPRSPASPRFQRLLQSRLLVASLVIGLGSLFFLFQNSQGRARGPGALLPSVLANSAGDSLLRGTQASGPQGRNEEASPDAMLAATATPNDPLAALRVRVLDQLSGQAQAGAKLRAKVTGRDGSQHEFEAISDERGELTLPIAPDDILHLTLQARGPANSMARSHLDLGGARFEDRTPLEMRLIKPREIGGRIIDEAGIPVLGAQVQLRLTESYNNQLRRVKDFLATQTNADGYWNLPTAPEFPAHFLLSIFHPDFVPLLAKDLTGSLSSEELWSGEAQTVMRAGKRTTLRIADQSGAALRGSHARIVETKDPAFYGIEMTPDESGAYVFTLGEDKEFFLTAGAPGFGHEQRGFSAEQVGNELVWKMEPRSVRRVRVIDAKGQGLAGALVRPFINTWDKTVTSDSQGYVRLELRREAWTLIQIQRPGVLGLVNHLVQPGDQSIQMPPFVAFDLEVRDATSGQALTDYVVTVFHPGRFRRGRSWGANTDTAHWVRFHSDPYVPKQDLPPRPVRVLVEHEGYLPFESEELHSEGFPASLLAELLPAESILLTLLNPAGKPALETIVVLPRHGQNAVLIDGELSIASRERPLTQRLLRGTARITLPREAFTLMAANDSGFLRLTSAELRKLGENPIVRLQAWGCIEGSTSSKSRVRLLAVRTWADNLELNYSKHPKRDGSFHFCKVPAGCMALSLVGQAPSARRASQANWLDHPRSALPCPPPG